MSAKRTSDAELKTSLPKWAQKLLVVACVLAITGSALWIYHFEFGSTGTNLRLQQSVGQILATETARVTGRPAKIVLVTVNAPSAPELKYQLEAFQKELHRIGDITVQDKVVLDPGDSQKYRAGAGLSSKHLLKIMRKHSGVDAIVSLVGVPEIPDQDLAQVKSEPKIVAETHSPEKLVGLLEKKILVSAIVPRFEFPAPGPRKPKTNREWFDRYFQIITPDSHLAAAEETP
jgi:hypothetical protein